MYKIKVIVGCIILFSCSLNSGASCVFTEAYFRYDNDGKYLYTLKLNRNGTLVLRHKAWSHGQENNVSLNTYKGRWQCMGNEITLKYSNQIEQGTYEKMGVNQSGFAPWLMSLKVGSSNGLLDGLILIEYEV